MSDGKQCPACERDVGVWAVFSAGLPNRIRCPHCRTRLGYANIAGVVCVLLVVMALVVAAGYAAAVSIPGSSLNTQLALFAAVVLGAWVPVELIAVRFLRGNRRLVRGGADAGPSPETGGQS